MGENFGIFKSFGDRLFEGETPTNLGLIGSLSVLDVDVFAFFNRVIAAGGTLTVTEQIAVNDLVLSMKSANIWTAMKAIYPMVGGSAAACAQNLKSASYTGSFSSGWTFSSLGVTPNGTSAFLNTNFIPSSESINNNTHISFYSRSNIQEAASDMGIYKNGAERWSMEANYYLGGISYGFASDQYNYTTGRVATANTNSQGFYLGTRTNSTTHKAFKNNTQLGTTNTGASGSITNINANIYIGGTNGAGSAASYSSKQNAFASIGDGLTDTQASDFYTAVQAFQTTLGRQISGYDTDAQAFFDRVTAAGGSLTATEQTAVNTLVLDMKATGTWTSMKAIYPMVGGSSAACAQNLKSSSFTGTFTSGWSFSSLGVTPDGSSAYMNTGFIPSSNLSDNSTHGSLYLNTNNLPSLNEACDFGAFNSVTQSLTLVQSSQASLSFSSRNLGAAISTTQATRTGFGITSKTSATVTTLYKNGVNVASGNSGGTLPTVSCYIGNLNLNGFPYIFGYANNRIAFHSLGDSLDSTQATNLYNSVQTFQTTLSRQV